MICCTSVQRQTYVIQVIGQCVTYCCDMNIILISKWVIQM